MGVGSNKSTIGTPNSVVVNPMIFLAFSISFTASKNINNRTLKSTVGTGKSTVTRPYGRFSNYYRRFCRFNSTVTTPNRG